MVQALLLDASGDPAAAGESYKKAGELDPLGRGCWAYMARLSRGLRDQELLPDAVRRAATMEPDGKGELFKARVLALPDVFTRPLEDHSGAMGHGS